MSGGGQFTLYNSTAAQEENMPFVTQGFVINEEASQVSLTEPSTWGIS
jgi:hypothetical protein